ncbi:hypothetical protein K493DRAFT_314185 [Basidiobolus meristosporus CBS 931.73]|uniref:Uncharacterized protein n=1 Tax=Basidiobolus meristosporus CBS 931.73 TaxID=1314790 RepID=A0A1Y1YGN6_9FUNG|nr:hypothetical protein K493DRAFT_314185 [Basidiobolus meristosporus CBS 931.73]|eukprot:ORX97210.1 hypothetical protein K493DRAFT_314185 [Basidiobolus meristosporus CBS 931.73]
MREGWKHGFKWSITITGQIEVLPEITKWKAIYTNNIRPLLNVQASCRRAFCIQQE